VRSPKFNFHGQVEIDVAVNKSPLPFGVDCLVRNNISEFNPQISDMIFVNATADDMASSY
jgi:hypothetical protein